MSVPLKFAVAYSEDGLKREGSPNNPVGAAFEMAGGTRFNGCYYLAGQLGGSHFGNTRKLEIRASYDFEHWTHSSCLGLRRDNIPPRPMTYDFNAGEQIHLGAALWNRGNVIIGFYGQWHGFENIGEETLFWYAPWPEHDSDGIRVASWTRDRLGYFQSFLGPEQNSHFISAPIHLEDKPARIYMNIDGLSKYSQISVEILDEKFRKIPGYSRAECVAPKESGLRQLVRWQDRQMIEKVRSPVRIQVNFEGVRPEDLKLYTLYIEHAS